jgi:hypothetical protein
MRLHVLLLLPFSCNVYACAPEGHGMMALLVFMLGYLLMLLMMLCMLAQAATR